MSSITIAEAQAKLSDFIHSLQPGQELVITEHNRPVAKIVPAASKPTPRLGTLRGSVSYMSADFDAPLSDFKEYT